MLRKAGITPVVTEKDELFGKPPFYNGIPKKSVKKLGISLLDTINYIEHAEFFVGLSSGLSWLAHGLGKKVAMISNFSEDWYEFDINDENYIRIINRDVCHGCWNKVGIDFDFVSQDWFWCPKHKGTDRHFECHTSITPQFVFDSIKKWI
jgi:autotransporter strand-loop-strand O-heptosyltransferase